MTTKKYLVAGQLVEATKSEGGRFYDVVIVKTGEKGRFVAQAFESVALEIVKESDDLFYYIDPVDGKVGATLKASKII